MNKLTTKEIEKIMFMLDNNVPCSIPMDKFSAVLAEIKELRTLCEKQSQIITTQSMYISKYIDGER